IFWDVPDDSRGALRWSLSKIRPFVDDPSYARLVADRQTVELRTERLDVDLFAAQCESRATGGHRFLTRAAYEEMGRLEGALRQHADRVIALGHRRTSCGFLVVARRTRSQANSLTRWLSGGGKTMRRNTRQRTP